MKNSSKHTLRGMLCACLCGVFTGVLTAIVILIYKICAGAVISFSEAGYLYLREHLYWLPLPIVALGIVAVIFARIYKKYPYLQGGGIPTSIGILRGFITFDWLKSLVGIFILSVTTFFIGVPLGNEGPAVQMGTAVGRCAAKMFSKSRQALDRYAMTGGACAGFSSATGAPISGILFAIEEAHGKFSPLVLLVSSVSVLSSRAVSELIFPMFGVSISLFPDLNLTALPAHDLWLPVLVGLAVGLFSVLFLKYYKLLYNFSNKALKKHRRDVLIFIIFSLTLTAGLFSFSFISTGHELITELLENAHLLPLVLILFIRTTLTLSANTTGITGGIFVPVLSLGALVAAVICSILKATVGLSAEYGVLILFLGITACVAGTMKMPLTAVVFAVEALSCSRNLLSVITVAITAFAITELFGVHSINEHVLEGKLESLNTNKTFSVYDAFVTVQPDSFAVGKQIRDVLWPASLFILSLKHNPEFQAQAGEISGKVLCAGDILHVRYSSFDSEETKSQLLAIVGNQQYAETPADNL